VKRAYFYYISLNLDIDSALCQEQNSMYSIIAMDEQGCIIEFNSAAEETFGWSRSKVLGKKLAEIIISPSLREAFERDLRHDLETGEHSILDRRIEIDAIPRNGTTFPVELGITAVRVDHQRVLTAYVRDICSTPPSRRTNTRPGQVSR
jgi:PAS domain S-box-containing protein